MPDKKETVDHPAHYTRGRVEVIEFIEALGGPFSSFHLANVIKYVLRSPFKGNELEDLEKALFYLKRWNEYGREYGCRSPHSKWVCFLLRDPEGNFGIPPESRTASILNAFSHETVNAHSIRCALQTAINEIKKTTQLMSARLQP